MNLYWIFIIWLATGIMGLISMPASRLIFKFSSDNGYAFSKIIGWFAVSYIAFLAATVKLLPLPMPALAAAVFLWAAFNLCLFLRKPGNILPGLRTIIATEAVFLSAFSLALLIKSFQPEIYQIERFMDYGFIQALRNSASLPLQDIWFAGANLNYYYFGHFIGFAVLTLTGIATLPGFYILVALIFALLVLCVYRLSADAFLLFSNFKKILPALAGSLSVFFTLIAGTWYMAYWLFKAIMRAGSVPFFYPEPTRIIPGTITEMPIYSFIVAELHAHIWGMLSGILILAILYSLWQDKEAKISYRNLYFWALAFVLGVSYMINSWDAATLGFLSVAVLIVKYWKENKIRIFAFTALLAAAAYIFAIPWAIFYKAPIAGMGIAVFKSPFWEWLSFWGSAVTVVIIYSILKRKSLFSLPGVIMYSAVFFILLMDLIYVKDILSAGEWYRANTVFKLAIQAWLWINIFAGPLFIWLYLALKNQAAKVFYILLLAIYIFIGSLYPIIAIKQSSLDGRKFTGVASGLDWWRAKYPDDYEAYLFLENLRKNLPARERMKTIVEAEGDSYTDVSRFSVFLGWPTIVGWPVHEWTWRGSYDEVGKRREEVRKIYTGFDMEATRKILESYNVDYIIVGRVEKDRYGSSLQTEKLIKLGNVIFEKGETFIVEPGNVCFGSRCFNVDLAITQDEQAKGLMFREQLQKNGGMLFIFEKEDDYSFWMKNTLIPLDIIWLNKEKRVVFISKNVQPCSTEPCPSINPGKPAQYVLELNAGIAEEIGLEIGDEMLYNGKHLENQ